MITEEQISDIIQKSFGHRVLDPAPGVIDDLRMLVIAAASFGHLESVDQLSEQASFIKSLETTLEKYEQDSAIDAAGQHALAAAEARERGMAFMVDGKHVNADRVMILSVPDTIGPISDMRRAKEDARAALQELNLARDAEMLPALAPVLALLEEVYRSLGSPYGLVRSETRLLVRQFLDLIPKKTDPTKDTPAGTQWIDGILVTDPALAAPITEPTVGVTVACGVCGLPFSDDPSSLFCATHRE